MPPTESVSVPATYADLRRAVNAAMILGQRAVELAKVRTYHETGRLIVEHLLRHQDRANYGTQTIRRLAGDMQVHPSVLHRCVSFFRSFPIVATWQQLSWAHYRVLITVADAKLRRSLANEANRNAWPVARLEQRIRSLLQTGPNGARSSATPELLEPKRGRPGICRVIDAGAGPVVDLGFACYFDLPPEAKSVSGTFVTFDPNGKAVTATEATKADLFTYVATVLKVVDGDTLWVKIHLRPGLWIKQKLRFRDLDCPEMDTPEGQTAKRFVSALMRKTKAVTVCTTKPDKYDRYLADVFLTLTDGKEVFLNNELLANGQAIRKGAYSHADWETV